MLHSFVPDSNEGLCALLAARCVVCSNCMHVILRMSLVFPIHCHSKVLLAPAAYVVAGEAAAVTASWLTRMTEQSTSYTSHAGREAAVGTFLVVRSPIAAALLPTVCSSVVSTSSRSVAECYIGLGGKRCSRTRLATGEVLSYDGGCESAECLAAPAQDGITAPADLISRPETSAPNELPWLA
jgi:hypothetical protein